MLPHDIVHKVVLASMIFNFLWAANGTERIIRTF